MSLKAGLKRHLSEDEDEDEDNKGPADVPSGESNRAEPTSSHGGKAAAMAEIADEDRKLEEKRAYNRRNAARARKRTKDQLAELCRKVESLTDRSEALEATNSALTKRVVALTEENMLLRRIILDKQTQAAAVAGMPSVAPSSGGGGAQSATNFPFGSGYGAGPGGQAGGQFPFNSFF
jgi:hypothetical protein